MTGRARIPLLTMVATGVGLVAAVVQYAVPSVVPWLERVPGGGIPAGEWWRWATPILVQTLGWYQAVFNLVTLVVIGTAAERLLGRRAWVLLFAAGTVGARSPRTAGATTVVAARSRSAAWRVER